MVVVLLILYLCLPARVTAPHFRHTAD